MADIPKAYIFDEDAVRRTRESVRYTETLQQRIPSIKKINLTPGQTCRIRLVTPLEHLAPAIGRILRLAEVGDEDFRWVTTEEDVEVYAGSMSRMRFDKGTELTVTSTGDGTVSITDGLMAINSTGRDLIPYGIYPIRGSNSQIPGAVSLGVTGELGENWDWEYAALGKVPVDKPGMPQPSRGDEDGVTPNNKYWPCVTNFNTPQWVAYDESGIGAVPQKIKDALGWSSSQSPGRNELWAPGPNGKLRRTVQTLSLYWWQYTPPDPVCTPNFSYVLGQPTWALAPPLLGFGASFRYNFIIPTFGPGTWELSANCPGYWRGTPWCCEPLDSGTGIVSPNTNDDIPPALEEKGYWIAPTGWWNGWGVAGWGGAWTPYSSPGWYYGGNYFGAWGYGWWNTRWGGRPPTTLDIDTSGAPATDTYGGEIVRLCRYAWIVWQWGYRVLDVDTKNKLALIIGPIRFSTSQVTDHNDYHECLTSSGTGSVPIATTAPPPTTAPPTSAPPTTSPPTTAPPTTAPPTTAPPTTAPPTTPPPATLGDCCCDSQSCCMDDNITESQCHTGPFSGGTQLSDCDETPTWYPAGRCGTPQCSGTC